MESKITKFAQEISIFLAFDQPRLTVKVVDNDVIVSGDFDIKPRNDDLTPGGRLDRFKIKLEIPREFPNDEPRLFETLERIPHEEDRHVNSDGSCCFEVWETWVAKNHPVTFERFFNELVQDYFFGQHYYEQYKKWPYGEHQHGKQGVLESYAEVLGCKAEEEDVRYCLLRLSNNYLKGHILCPCGSRKKLRCCCCTSMYKEQPPVKPDTAKWMKKRFDARFKSKT